MPKRRSLRLVAAAVVICSDNGRCWAFTRQSASERTPGSQRYLPVSILLQTTLITIDDFYCTAGVYSTSNQKYSPRWTWATVVFESLSGWRNQNTSQAMQLPWMSSSTASMWVRMAIVLNYADQYCRLSCLTAMVTIHWNKRNAPANSRIRSVMVGRSRLWGYRWDVGAPSIQRFERPGLCNLCLLASLTRRMDKGKRVVFVTNKSKSWGHLVYSYAGFNAWLRTCCISCRFGTFVARFY